MTRRKLKRVGLGPLDPRHKIRELRQEQGVSLPQLAAATGYADHGWLCFWLLGKEGVDIKVGRLVKILEALGHKIEIVPIDQNKKPGG